MRFLILLLPFLFGFVPSNDRTEGIDYIDSLNTNYVTIQKPLVTNFEHILKHITSPSNPGSGFTKVFGKSDNLLYYRDSSGVETRIGNLRLTGSVNDNRLLKTDGTSGNAAQETDIIVDDSENVTGVNSLTAAGLTVTGTTTLNTGLNGFLKAVSGVVSAQALISLTADVTGVLGYANGGTNCTSRCFVDLTSTESIDGTKTFNEGGIFKSLVKITDESTPLSYVFTITDFDELVDYLTVGATGINTQLDIFMNGTGALKLPVGTTAQRPASPVEGQVRRNSQIPQWEGYNGSTWESLAASNSTFNDIYDNSVPATIDMTATGGPITLYDRESDQINGDTFRVMKEIGGIPTQYFNVSTLGGISGNQGVEVLGWTDDETEIDSEDDTISVTAGAVKRFGVGKIGNDSIAGIKTFSGQILNSSTTDSFGLPSLDSTAEGAQTPSVGWVHWNTTTGSVRVYNGSIWENVGGGVTSSQVNGTWVYFSVATNNGQNCVATTATRIEWEDIFSDSHSAYNSLTGEFDPPDGVAQCCFSGCIATEPSSDTAGESYILYLAKAGTAYRRLARNELSDDNSGGEATTCGSACVPVSNGDIFTVIGDGPQTSTCTASQTNNHWGAICFKPL